MGKWIKHTSLIRPVPEDTIVIAVLEDGYKLSPMRAGDIDWDCVGDNVLKYKIIEY